MSTKLFSTLVRLLAVYTFAAAVSRFPWTSVAKMGEVPLDLVLRPLGTSLLWALWFPLILWFAAPWLGKYAGGLTESPQSTSGIPLIEWVRAGVFLIGLINFPWAIGLLFSNEGFLRGAVLMAFVLVCLIKPQLIVSLFTSSSRQAT
jgi:hypothetical protein